MKNKKNVIIGTSTGVFILIVGIVVVLVLVLQKSKDDNDDACEPGDTTCLCDVTRAGNTCELECDNVMDGEWTWNGSTLLFESKGVKETRHEEEATWFSSTGAIDVGFRVVNRDQVNVMVVNTYTNTMLETFNVFHVSNTNTCFVPPHTMLDSKLTRVLTPPRTSTPAVFSCETGCNPSTASVVINITPLPPFPVSHFNVVRQNNAAAGGGVKSWKVPIGDAVVRDTNVSVGDYVYTLDYELDNGLRSPETYVSVVVGDVESMCTKTWDEVSRTCRDSTFQVDVGSLVATFVKSNEPTVTYTPVVNKNGRVQFGDGVAKQVEGDDVVRLWFASTQSYIDPNGVYASLQLGFRPTNDGEMMDTKIVLRCYAVPYDADSLESEVVDPDVNNNTPPRLGHFTTSYQFPFSMESTPVFSLNSALNMSGLNVVMSNASHVVTLRFIPDISDQTSPVFVRPLNATTSSSKLYDITPSSSSSSCGGGDDGDVCYNVHLEWTGIPGASYTLNLYRSGEDTVLVDSTPNTSYVHTNLVYPTTQGGTYVLRYEGTEAFTTLFVGPPTLRTIFCRDRGIYNVDEQVCMCDTPYSGLTCQVVCHDRGNVVNGECVCSASNVDPSTCAYTPVHTCNGNGTPDPITGVCTCEGQAVGRSNAQCGFTSIDTCNGNGTPDPVTGVCACTYPTITNDDCAFTREDTCSGRGTPDLITGECTCDDDVVDVTDALSCAYTRDMTCHGNGDPDPVTGVCACDDPDHTTPTCQYTPEASCNNQGYVDPTTNTCVCMVGDNTTHLMDDHCAYTDVTACSGNGTVVSPTDRTCTCNPGFSGSTCDVVNTYHGCNLNQAGKDCSTLCHLMRGNWKLVDANSFEQPNPELFQFNDAVQNVDNNNIMHYKYTSVQQTTNGTTPRVSLEFHDVDNVMVEVEGELVSADGTTTTTSTTTLSYGNRDACLNVLALQFDNFLLSSSPGAAQFVSVVPSVVNAPPFLTNVELTWTPPMLEPDVDLVSYTLARNNDVVATLGADVTVFVDTPPAGVNYTYTLSFVANYNDQVIVGDSRHISVLVPIPSSLCTKEWDEVTGTCTDTPFDVVVSDVQMFFTNNNGDDDDERMSVPPNVHGILTFSGPPRKEAFMWSVDSDQTTDTTTPPTPFLTLGISPPDENSKMTLSVTATYETGVPFQDFLSETYTILHPSPPPQRTTLLTRTTVEFEVDAPSSSSSSSLFDLRDLLPSSSPFTVNGLSVTLREPLRVLPLPLVSYPPTVEAYKNDASAPRNTVKIRTGVDVPNELVDVDDDVTYFMTYGEEGHNGTTIELDTNAFYVMDVAPETKYTYTFYYTTSDGADSALVSYDVDVGTAASFCNEGQWSDLTQLCYPELRVTMPKVLRVTRVANDTEYATTQNKLSVVTFQSPPQVTTLDEDPTPTPRLWFTSVQNYQTFYDALDDNGELVVLSNTPVLRLGFRYLPSGLMEMMAIANIYTNSNVTTTSQFVQDPEIATGFMMGVTTLDAQASEFFNVNMELPMEMVCTNNQNLTVTLKLDVSSLTDIQVSPPLSMLNHVITLPSDNGPYAVNVTLTWEGSLTETYTLTRVDDNNDTTTLLSNTHTFTYTDTVNANEVYIYRLNYAHASVPREPIEHVVVLSSYENLCKEQGRLAENGVCKDPKDVTVATPIVQYDCTDSNCANTASVLLQYNTNLETSSGWYTLKFKDSPDGAWTYLKGPDAAFLESSSVMYEHKVTTTKELQLEYSFTASDDMNVVPETVTSVTVYPYSENVCKTLEDANPWGHKLYNSEGYCVSPTFAENLEYCMTTNSTDPPTLYGEVSNACSRLTCSDPLKLEDGTELESSENYQPRLNDLLDEATQLLYKQCWCSGEGEYNFTTNECECENENGLIGYYNGLNCSYPNVCDNNDDPNDPNCYYRLAWDDGGTRISPCVEPSCAGTRRVDLSFVVPFSSGTFSVERLTENEWVEVNPATDILQDNMGSFSEYIDANGSEVTYRVKVDGYDDDMYKKVDWTEDTFSNPVYTMQECMDLDIIDTLRVLGSTKEGNLYCRPMHPAVTNMGSFFGETPSWWCGDGGDVQDQMKWGCFNQFACRNGDCVGIPEEAAQSNEKVFSTLEECKETPSCS